MPIVRRPVNLELIILERFDQRDFTYWRRNQYELQQYLGLPGNLTRQMFATLRVLVSEAYLARNVNHVRGEGRRVTYCITDLGCERLEELQAKTAA